MVRQSDFEEKNIYLRINMYVIRDLYNKIAKDEMLNNLFLEVRNGKTVKKKISDVLSIQKQRLDRILTTSSKSRISKEEAKSISSIFNISEDIFLIDKNHLIYNGIPTIDWATFFQEKCKSEKKSLSNYCAHNHKKIGEIKKSIEYKLLELYRGLKEGNYTYSEEIYRVWWYFTKGSTYIDNIDTRIKTNIDTLMKIEPEEWKRANITVIKETVQRLETIVETLKAYLICKEKKFF